MAWKRTPEDQEWDARRAEVQKELARLMGKYGAEAVVAACAEFVHRQTLARERETFEVED